MGVFLWDSLIMPLGLHLLPLSDYHQQSQHAPWIWITDSPRETRMTQSLPAGPPPHPGFKSSCFQSNPNLWTIPHEQMWFGEQEEANKGQLRWPVNSLIQDVAVDCSFIIDIYTTEVIKHFDLEQMLAHMSRIQPWVKQILVS